MSQPWIKFYPRDWRGDQALRACSLAARGLWMEMICVMHEASPYGHLLIAGQPVKAAVLARLVGATVLEAESLMDELQAAGVFRRTRAGVVYSKRMTDDHRKAEAGRKAKVSALQQAAEKQQENPLPSRVPTRAPPTQKPEAREEDKIFADKAVGREGCYPEAFELAWKAYPQIRGRSSKPKSLAAWRRLPAEHRSALVAACTRYRKEGREPNADCGAPAMDRWLRDGRYADWLTEPSAKAGAVTPEIQAEREQHFRQTGEWRSHWGPRPRQAA